MALLLLIGIAAVSRPGIVPHALAASAVALPVGDFYADDVAEAARRFGVPAAWIDAVIRAESDGYRHSVSSKGAMGLMQLMPENWAEMRARYGLGDDPFDPHDNIIAGAALLRELHDRYGAPGFLAAYNAGPGRYEDYRDRHRNLPAETVAYVAKLAPMITGDVSEIRVGMASAVAADPLPWASAPLFVLHSARPGGDDLVAPKPSAEGTPTAVKVSDLSAIAPQSEGLFVVLSARNTAP